MAAVENSKYQELCRLCATKTTMVLAINIFENEGTIRQISKKICTCLPIQVHETDELPKMICENCLYKLELFCDFRERSARTERLLVELYKEINSDRTPTDQEPPCVVPIDHDELIMVQHHQLLNDHNLQNVSEIDLSQLGNREGMIVEHEIILTHHNVDMNSHSLDSIDLHNHELSNQDLSNQSLQTQESLMADSNPHSIPDARFTEDNLNLLQQHQLLTDQFRLQHDVPSVNMVDENSGNDIHLSNEFKTHLHLENQRYPLEDKIESIENCHNIHTQDYEVKLENNSFSVDSHHLNNVQLQNSFHKGETDYKTNAYKYEDSNSDHSLLVDEQLNVNVPNSVPDEKQIYDINVEENSSIDYSNKDSFYCNMCGKSYEQKSEFEEHYEIHFHTCKVCLAVFTNTDVLNSHRKEAHGACVDDPKPMKTRLKRATVPIKNENGLKAESPSEESEGEGDGECDNSQLEEEDEIDDPTISPDHNSIDNKRKKWSPKVCKECGKTYKTNYKLAEHMRKHTGEKPYKCKSCEKAFRSKIGLAQHEAKHTGQYDFSCSICGKGFQCKSYLMVHQRVHSDLKLFPCTTCGQNFKTKQSLVDHTNRHLGVKPYMCDICGRGFITKGLCRAHQKVHSGLDNRKYSCKICSKMFVSKSYLQTHLRIHTGEKPFLCEVCGKGFLTRVDLKIHSTMHTGEKSYVCEICDKAFARRDALRCHRRSHTGERPYSCDLCGQTFTQFTPMAIHKRLHTGERPYACETCGKTFVSRSTMMSHAKKHVR